MNQLANVAYYLLIVIWMGWNTYNETRIGPAAFYAALTVCAYLAFFHELQQWKTEQKRKANAP